MKHITCLVVLVLLTVPALYSGPLDSSVEPPAVITLDTSLVTAKPRLLPENMSFMENTMWGEHGVLRSLGIASPLTPEVRKSELSLRRTMLTAHQIGGFVTLGLMGTTAYFGQRTLDGHVTLSDKHSLFARLTIISYSVTALLAVLSPPPYIRRDEWSTTTTHKTLAWLHAAGMILTPIVGGMVWHFQRYPVRTMIQNDSAARFHQISAYITTAILAAAMAVMTF